MKQLVLATRNQHKIAEIKIILHGLEIELLTLNEFPQVPPLVEDGHTFQENALSKARTVHRHTKLPALADDSGLEVFFLNGRPGVYSARYAGKDTTYELNNEKLLREMRGVAPRRRKIRFVAVLALVGSGYEELAAGDCSGKLAETPRGSNGFGYDPIFIPDGYHQTYAQLMDEEKNRISHRARALEKMKPILLQRL